MRGSLFDGKVDHTSSVLQRKPLLFVKMAGSSGWPEGLNALSSSPRSYLFTSATVRTPVYTATKGLFTW